MKRWHFMNYWRLLFKWSKDWKGFSLLNFWVTDVSSRIVICDLGVEYLRDKFFEPWKPSVYESVTFPNDDFGEMMPKTRVLITK